MLKPSGLSFVNFTSVDDLWYEKGQRVCLKEYVQEYEWYLDIVKEEYVQLF
ncbi:MAG: hypothetical protein HXS53_09530 [Theionarchaea archaeon]|nr:hypothetical protein [Theionarchaea archaeon]